MRAKFEKGDVVRLNENALSGLKTKQFSPADATRLFRVQRTKVNSGVNEIVVEDLETGDIQEIAENHLTLSVAIYNEKEFLLPESIRSMAAVHGKIFRDGRFVFRIHDCNTGVKLVNDLTKPAEVAEAIEKLRTLAKSADRMADYISSNFNISKTKSDV